jgi:hypothetical protein
MLEVQISMNNPLLILLLSNAVPWYREDEPRFTLHLKAELSKVDYSSKTKGSITQHFFSPIGTLLRPVCQSVHALAGSITQPAKFSPRLRAGGLARSDGARAAGAPGAVTGLRLVDGAPRDGPATG